MFNFRAKLLVALLLAFAGPVEGETTLFRDEFKNLDQWIMEQQPGGKVEARDGALFIHDAEGCTVWFRQKLTAPVSIKYDAVVRSTGRVSDLNCFWMASDPNQPADLFQSAHPRNGAFAQYDVLQTYYVGYGGNNNSTTRFRRYRGDGTKPLLPTHDLREPRFLLEPERVYHLELFAQGGVARFIRDGEVLFDFHDDQPLTMGWFGLRTVKAEIEIRNFRVLTPELGPSVTVR